MRKLAVTTLVSLLLTIGIAVAWGGPDGTIDTYFYADGIMPVYHSALVLNGGEDYVIEKVWTGWGEVMVIENIDIEDHGGWCYSWADANVDKYIEIDPGFFGTAHVEKTAVWDGFGEVYRQAWLGDDTYEVVKASTVFGDALFIDDIEYNDNLVVYESVGLNRPATCEDPVPPAPIEPPTCEGWFCR